MKIAKTSFDRGIVDAQDRVVPVTPKRKDQVAIMLRECRRRNCWNLDPPVHDDNNIARPRSRSCIRAFFNPLDKQDSCGAAFLNPKQWSENCQDFFRPRDPVEVEEVQQAIVSDSNSTASPGPRRLDSITIDRAISRSMETASVAKKATSGLDRHEERNGSNSSTTLNQSESQSLNSSSKTFIPDHAVEGKVDAILRKAERDHHHLFLYERAMGYYLAVLSLLSKAGYPDDHPITAETMRKLNDCHHAQSSLRNSANIVKMGIKYENKGQFVRALKMYTISYRIRKDSLGNFHPSLSVLLNMLGSVQVKRGDLKEAMQIYDLALNGRSDDLKGVSVRQRALHIHPSTKAVTLRDMGMIYERWGKEEKALKLYCESLDNILQGRERERASAAKKGQIKQSISSKLSRFPQSSTATYQEPKDQHQGVLKEVKFIRSHKAKKKAEDAQRTPRAPSLIRRPPIVELHCKRGNQQQRVLHHTLLGSSYETNENGEMEVYLDTAFDSVPVSTKGLEDPMQYNYYNVIFPPKESSTGTRAEKGEVKDGKLANDLIVKSGSGGNNVNAAMTLHQIAQIHRRRESYAASLSAYQASLRGMRQALGDRHPNIAAILGNFANLHKEMGNYDEAYDLYQEVLGIETLHLGSNHPEVSITLHNIATIESSRGQYANAITLYRLVLKNQKELFRAKHIAVAVTSCCMGDVYERMGDTKNAAKMFKESFHLREEILGRNHADVGRLLHKLGNLLQKMGDFQQADHYLSRAAGIYKSNGMNEEHPWMRDMKRDRADILARLSL